MGKVFAQISEKAISSARDLAGHVLEMALPPVCPLTGDRVLENGTLSPAVWAELSFITRPSCAVSGLPFERDMGEGVVSPSVIARPPLYDRARAALVYEGTAQRLVHQLKYSDRLELAPLVARWMVLAGQDLLADADVIAPVPLHVRRLIWRRYNQAAVLAKVIGRDTGLCVQPDLLERIRPTQSQVGLSRAGRRRNVRGAFRVATAHARAGTLVGKNIVLVDDVLTSGATVEACAGILRRAGASRVDVLTAARVVAPQDVPI